MWSILGRRRPRRGPHRGRGQRHGPGRRPPPGGPGLRRPDHRGHLPVRADQPRHRVLRQRRAPPPRWSPSTGAASACPPVFLHSQWVSWVEIESGAELHVRHAAGPQRAPLAQPARAGRHPRPGRRLAPPLAGRLLPGGRLVAAGPRPAPGPPPHPSGPPLGGRRHPRHRDHRPPRLHHPAAARSPPRARAVPAASGQRGRRCPGGPGRPRPHRPRPRHPARPAPGLAGVGGPARRHHPPPRRGRCRHRGVAHHRGGPGLPPGQPQGVPGRLRRHVACGRPSSPSARWPSASPWWPPCRSSCSPTSGTTTTRPSRGGPTFWAVSERFVGITTIDLPERADRFLAPALLDHRDLPGGRDPVPADPAGGRPPAGLGPGRRVPGPGHRAPPRLLDPRLLRPPVGQAVVLPPGQPGGLRRLRRGLPDLPRPHRPPQRARAGVGRLPGLRRHPRLDHGGHGGGRGRGSPPTATRACTTSTWATRPW